MLLRSQFESRRRETRSSSHSRVIGAGNPLLVFRGPASPLEVGESCCWPTSTYFIAINGALSKSSYGDDDEHAIPKTYGCAPAAPGCPGRCNRSVAGARDRGNGTLTYEDAVLEILLAFPSKGHLIFYWEPIREIRSKVSEKRRLLHPEILRALKNLTGNKIIWVKECREWFVKGVGERERRTRFEGKVRQRSR